jgi:hypothetical protein
MAERQSPRSAWSRNQQERFEVMDELVNSADEPPLAGQLDLHLDNVVLHTEFRRLVAEQAALRRLGTLVARRRTPAFVTDCRPGC